MTTKRKKWEEGQRKEAERIAQREAAIARLEKRQRARKLLQEQAARRLATARAIAAVHEASMRAEAEPIDGRLLGGASASPPSGPPADSTDPVGEPTPPSDPQGGC